ncbi:MAG: hypothetical protein NTX53_10550 [candidate division WOR-3 bacterium]|nr:hypothetical protein [candidate division WOR-3 bacterium]
MQSKLTPFVVCCLLYTICMGQWSSPVPLLHGSPSITGQALIAGTGDTMWAAVVTGHSGSSGPYQVLASWTTGDTWSLPAELTPLDSGRIFSEPGMGRDASGRLWVAWYRGDYPTKDVESSAVWAAFRDSAGWHPPARVCSGIAAEGPMSFAADAAGDWYLGFATLTPYLDFAYSSAVYCRLASDSWLAPRYIAQGMGSPIETNYSAPLLTPRPNSGIWAAYEMTVFGSSITMLSIVSDDTARLCWSENGTDPATTVDSAGRLWILYSQLAMYWLSAQVIADSSAIDTMRITNTAGGRSCVGTDGEGLVWAAWPQRSPQRVVVSYTGGTEWSTPDVATDSVGVPDGIAADANGRIYVLFQTTAGQLYSVYRTSRPGVQEPGLSSVACSRLPTIVRGVLVLPEAVGGERSAVGAHLLDISGRKVLDLKPGTNDVSRLTPGVYFVRKAKAQAQAQAQTIRKVVLTR